jgi:TonB-dependent SusC/RagA subfamily outer membrane receptor
MIALVYYLLKVIICSGILFLYYHFALRNKIFHQWNRFYLLAAVALSLTLPLIQIAFYHYTEAPNQAIKLLRVVESADNYMEEIYIRQHQAMSAVQWLGISYFAVSIVILATLIISLAKIYFIIKTHRAQLIGKIRFVATQEPGTPFSFLRYIFWNDKIDIHSSTGQQIFQHELVHVREAHTFDKLFLQITLILFWCNPFFWRIRKELQMIHEFIADKKAVQQHDTANFAAMILQASYPHQFSHITNPFFQSSIKRRLLMLTKIQNPSISYLSRILALPLIAFVVLAFSFRTKTASIISLEKPITVVIDAGHGRQANGTTTGAREGNIYEDDIVLSLAKKVKELNANSKINIVLTRTSKDIVDLHKRVDIAKEKNADLFISLHMAATEPGHDGSGMEVYVSNKNTAYQQQSEMLGSVMKEELNSVYSTNPTLIKRQVGVWVIDHNACPSILVECGYLTNQKDRSFITNEANQKIVAEKILSAIERFAASNKTSSLNTLTDTLPQRNVNEIKAVNVNKNEGKITITYVDGSSETLTIEQAKQRNLITENRINNKGSNESGKPVLTIRGEIKPIYFVDGKEFKGDLNKIDPNKIQSINVLKDQAAIAKYGEKGKNGVVEIITKPGNKTNIFDTVPKTTPVFTKPEVEASVNKKEWRTFLEKNLQPVIEYAAGNGMPTGQYTVNLRFLVKKDGSITDFKALNDPGYGLVQKVLAIIPNSPQWKPAEQNGEPVNSYHTQPITFVISEGSDSKEKNNSGNTYPNIGAAEIKLKGIHDLLWVNQTDEIVSFTMTIDSDNGNITSVNHSGNQYTNADKNFLNQYVKPGKLMTIEQILVRIDGALKKIPSKMYFIRS